MSADLLRRAAALIRERSEAVAKSMPPPWWVLNPHDTWVSVWYGDQAKVKGIDDGTVPEEEWEDIYETSGSLDNSDWDPPLGRHVASWHPAVTLAVANWLDEQAGCLEEDATTFRFATPESREAMYADALAVARAYLGES